MGADAQFDNFGKLFRLICWASGKQLTLATKLNDASEHLFLDLDEKIDSLWTILQANP